MNKIHVSGTKIRGLFVFEIILKKTRPPLYSASSRYCHNRSTKIPGWDEMYGMCVTAYYNIPWVNSEGNIERTGSAPTQ